MPWDNSYIGTLFDQVTDFQRKQEDREYSEFIFVFVIFNTLEFFNVPVIYLELNLINGQQRCLDDQKYLAVNIHLNHISSWKQR